MFVNVMIKQVTRKEVEDFFISLSNETGNLISNLKLQKLLYYAQAWHLAKFKKRLFDDSFQAWVHGPVLPGSYHDYKQFRWKPINVENLEESFHTSFMENLSDEQSEIMRDVVVEYFGENAYELELMTHKEYPWLMARNGMPIDEPSENVIEDQWMIDYYGKFLSNG